MLLYLPSGLLSTNVSAHALKMAYGDESKSFKFVVDGFGRKHNNAERIEIMKNFAHLPLKGFWLLFFVERSHSLQFTL